MLSKTLQDALNKQIVEELYSANLYMAMAYALTTFEEAYKHECHISECIHKLLDLAREHDDKPMQSFCWKFVEEQVEEEEVASGIVEMLRNMGNGTIFPLDHALGER